MTAERDTRLALALIGALTLWRLAWLPLSDMELYVDEAQYWLWGQELAAGAYSKPPLVGWLIRLANEVMGSDAPWVARLPWPLVHGAAALAVLALGRRLAGPAVGALAGAVYATLPAVAVGSILISTDSPQMLALALTLWLWHRQAAGGGATGAVLLGAAIAAGMWSKYAMLFPLAGLAAAALADRDWRLRPAHAALALATVAALFAPNVVWNLTHDLATLRHTAENADWQGTALHPAHLATFWAEQFAVAGPLTFAALLAAWLGARRLPQGLRGLALVAAAPLLVVSAQALKSEANANWAVGAYVGGAVLMALWLAPRPRWTVAALVLNSAIATALPVAGTLAHSLRADGRLVLARYVGQTEMTGWAVTTARALAGEDALIVLSDRALAADLFYARARRTDMARLRLAASSEGPDSHYRLTRPLRDEPGPAVWLGQADDRPDCAGPARTLTPEEGVWRGKTVALAPLPDACLDRLRAPR